MGSIPTSPTMLFILFRPLITMPKVSPLESAHALDPFHLDPRVTYDWRMLHTQARNTADKSPKRYQEALRASGFSEWVSSGGEGAQSIARRLGSPHSLSIILTHPTPDRHFPGDLGIGFYAPIRSVRGPILPVRVHHQDYNRWLHAPAGPPTLTIGPGEKPAAYIRGEEAMGLLCVAAALDAALTGDVSVSILPAQS